MPVVRKESGAKRGRKKGGPVGKSSGLINKSSGLASKSGGLAKKRSGPIGQSTGSNKFDKSAASSKNFRSSGAKGQERTPNKKRTGEQRFTKQPRDTRPEAVTNGEMVYGRNPVLEILRKRQGINKILLARGTSGSSTQIKAQAQEAGIPVQEVEPMVINRLVPGVAHQGVLAYVAPVKYTELDDILARCATGGENKPEPLLVLLDGLEDPHNLGAILRSVDGAGGNAVVIPKRRSVPLTAAVAKTSAGAVEHVPVARVTNLAMTIGDLRERGFLVVGTDTEAPVDYWSANYRQPVALVIGGEGKGMSRLVKEKCDLLVRIPMGGQVASLNASVSAALLLYEVLRQRGGAGEKEK